MADHREASPVNPLPPVVVALALVVFGVEFALWGAERAYWGGQAGIGWRTQAIRDYGYFGEVLDWDVVARTQVVLVIGCSTSDLDT